MYHFGKKKVLFVQMISLTLLWMTFFVLTAFGAGAPAGSSVIDALIQNVEAFEPSEKSGAENPAGSPGQADIPGSGRASVYQAPNKAAPSRTADDREVSYTSPAASAGSPVITCGSGKATPAPVKEISVKKTISRGASLGMFTTTGYCSCEECSEGYELTYSGTVPQAGHTVAADLSLFPIGTRLIIGDTVYTVEDIGSGVVGTHIDIYYDSHEAAMAHGKQLQEVFAAQ